MMRKTMLLVAILAVLAVPATALADDVTVQKSKTDEQAGPVAQVLLFPVRLVTGVIGAPIGAVGGLFTGFAKGYNWPVHKTSTTTTTTTHSQD